MAFVAKFSSKPLRSPGIAGCYRESASDCHCWAIPTSSGLQPIPSSAAHRGLFSAPSQNFIFADIMPLGAGSSAGNMTNTSTWLLPPRISPAFGVITTASPMLKATGSSSPRNCVKCPDDVPRAVVGRIHLIQFGTSPNSTTLINTGSSTMRPRRRISDIGKPVRVRLLPPYGCPDHSKNPTAYDKASYGEEDKEGCLRHREFRNVPSDLGQIDKMTACRRERAEVLKAPSS